MGMDTATPNGTIGGVSSLILFEMGDAVMEEGEYGSCIGQTLYGANPGTA
jgi:hypothetical protein